MFGIDVETFNTLWPSLIVVALMIGVMGWAIVKVMALMAKNDPNQVTHHRMNH
jgi:hypothetical protein